MTPRSHRAEAGAALPASPTPHELVVFPIHPGDDVVVHARLRPLDLRGRQVVTLLKAQGVIGPVQIYAVYATANNTECTLLESEHAELESLVQMAQFAQIFAMATQL